MVDVVCSDEPTIRINKQEYPHEVVKSRFLKIDSSHIEYIDFALRSNTSDVRNIRAFLITTIYRSFETADNWFAAKAFTVTTETVKLPMHTNMGSQKIKNFLGRGGIAE